MVAAVSRQWPISGTAGLLGDINCELASRPAGALDPAGRSYRTERLNIGLLQVSNFQADMSIILPSVGLLAAGVLVCILFKACAKLS